VARNSSAKYAQNRQAISDGHSLCSAHPLTAPLPLLDLQFEQQALSQGAKQWVLVECSFPRYGINSDYCNVVCWPNLKRRPEEWAYILGRIQLHVALNHLDPKQSSVAWHAACWYHAEALLKVAGIGQRPSDFPALPSNLPRLSEQALAMHFEENGVPPDLMTMSLGVSFEPFWCFPNGGTLTPELVESHSAKLAKGIRAAATAAVDVAGGVRQSMLTESPASTTARRAREWVISEFPLLAALASSFTLIEDEAICSSLGVEVAAIADEPQEIYINPRVLLSEQEARFVVAHEFLHSGLRHMPRRQGRDPWLWNVACDYVINDWLIEAQVGLAPERIGYLHDESLRGQSAEEVYDKIVGDLRWMRKLKKARTLNGNQPDMIEGTHPAGWWQAGGMDLDTFYRRALADGLELHANEGRGSLPASLVEEIRALQQPPIPWDVQLAHWLDNHFPPLEKRRSFARAHRRQSATPDIIRAAWVATDEQRASRVFGAVVDTSGSMSRIELGKAMGAIASYAMSRDVGNVRLIQCDANTHDSGYVEPESLLDRVTVKGRGGTVLMPAINLLEAADDFPKDGPILVITDGHCDALTIRGPHAFLVTDTGRLPFKTKGPVFYFA